MDDPLASVARLPGVAAAVESARESVDSLLGHRILRRRSAEVSAEAALRAAVASALLDGADVRLEAVRADLRSGDGPGAEPILRGALRVSAELGTLAPTWEQAPMQALARLHVLAATGRTETDRLGRPDSPVPGAAARLDALASMVTAPGTAPALVLAAVVHAELLAIRPFPVANGVVARAAQHLVIVSRGLDPKSVSVPEVGHRELGPAYEATLARYQTGTAAGVAAWIEHCAAAVSLGAREGVAICEAVARGPAGLN